MNSALKRKTTQTKARHTNSQRDRLCNTGGGRCFNIRHQLSNYLNQIRELELC